MGYTTDFYGTWKVTPALTPEHRAYLRAFSETRRMIRDEQIAGAADDPIRQAAGLPVGPQGAYFVGHHGHGGGAWSWEDGPGVLNPNSGGIQPDLWCHWTPTDDGTAIEWDGGEKFYNYVDWIAFLIEHFFEPWGYTLNGEVEWSGEESDDRGRIDVVDNTVTARQGRVVYE